jgi:hypothetical protein
VHRTRNSCPIAAVCSGFPRRFLAVVRT